MTEAELPLTGIRVVEFSHMAMGPSTGLILGDLGADVIKVEPLEGDRTRQLPGSGAGLFPAFNRNKRSARVDLKSPEGMDFVRRLLATADVVTENFRAGAMVRLGLGWDDLREAHPGLVYASLKGFLPGPYEDRTALDEVVQMMGGMAYMTGPPGHPLRAGASVNDIMGGMFAVIGILAALRRREATGLGGLVRSSLFENTAFLMSPHMAQAAMTGREVDPMPAREATWPVYDVFEVAEGQQVFLAAVTDSQWRALCETFGLGELLDDPRLVDNAARVAHREEIHARLGTALAARPFAEVCRAADAAGLPYAPVATPADLLENPHLAEPGAGIELDLGPETSMRMPALPLEIDGERLGLRRPIPAAGEHTRQLARELGLDEETIARLGA